MDYMDTSATNMSSEPLLPVATPGASQKNLKVLFASEAIAPLLLNITNVPTDTLTPPHLRQTVRGLRPAETAGHTLRFLRAGALLTSPLLRSQLAAYADSPSAEPFSIHCLIGVDTLPSTQDILAQEAQYDDGSLGQTGQGDGSAQGMGAIGFDRLRAVGFSDDEIDLLRAQFRATYGDLQGGGADTAEGPREETAGGTGDGATDMRELEEQWMENGVGDNDDRFNSVPHTNFRANVDMLIGVSVGFLFGVFALVLIKITGLFHRRQHMPMVLGMLMNLVFSFLLYTS